MTYNTSDAGASWDSRKSYLQSVIYDVDPDIIVAIEINNNNTDDFLTNVLGGAYSKGYFIANTIGGNAGKNSDCLYYKTSKFINGSFSNIIIPSFLDSAQNIQDRDINRFTITQNGGKTIVIYAIHLRADGGGADATKREIQISYLLNYISDNASSTTSENFIVLGDFNIQDPTEGAYQKSFFTQGGYFYDPSNPTEKFTGTWNQSEFINYLTWQSTDVTKKFDNILISGNVKDNTYGIQYNSSSFTVYGNPGNYGSQATSSDARSASDHLPVYATFNFTDNPSPVELVAFTGVLNENQVELNWRTETEVNNYGFNIERSIGNSNWLTIGFVEGHGNSNSPKRYNFIDDDINLSGKYYYRLKQIDNDGSFEYSDIVTIEAGIPNNYYLSQNYPNPFNPETRINYTLPEKQLIAIRVYNTLGEQVAELVNEEREAGSYSVTFDASSAFGGLPSGIYIYRLQTAECVVNKMMILLK